MITVDGATIGNAISTITITDNDPHNNAPTDIALSAVSTTQGQPVGTPVGNLSTTDPNPADAHTYTLVTGQGDGDNALFTIVGNQSRHLAAGFSARIHC